MKTNATTLRKSYLALSISAALSIGAKSNLTHAQERSADAGNEPEEVIVTGSRIVRRDLESNSPLITIDRQQLEDNAFVSVEEALNDLPQFMVGGPGMSGGAVTSLQGANGVDGGRGTGDMFNMSLLPDNAGMIGIVVPGAANVNLRGLGANRALTLIDGHRAMPTNASMTVDLNTIPSIAIAGVEVITGGASAVYGADALAGVTNIKFRDSFEGMSVRMRGGANEVSDGEEYQLGVLIGSSVGERAHALVGVEYTKREASYWAERDHFREVMESPYSGSGDYLFAWEPFYSPGGARGTFQSLQRAWSGNGPTQAAVNQVFSDRNCPDPVTGAPLNCVANATGGVASPFPPPALFAGYHFNPDGTLFVRGSQAVVNGVTTYFGPQGYNRTALGTEEYPDEIACTFLATGVSAYAPFAGEPCNPSAGNRVDYGRWLSSPREAYNLFARGTYDFDNGIEAFTNFHFASSDTETRREPAPYQGGFGAVIPFGGDEIYLPSLVQVPTAAQPQGATLPEYRVGGTKGTNCPDVGGCTMRQAFPVPAELRTLLESRPDVAIANTGANPFRGLSDCNIYALAANPGAPGTQTNPNSGAEYTVQVDPNTGLPLAKCGASAGWLFNQQLTALPPRGTRNTGRLYQLAAGLRGDFATDWTWEFYTSYGDSETYTNYEGFSSMVNYTKIISAPNYGRGFVENGATSKFLTCSSGLNPFDPNLVISPDCIEAIQSNQVDRNLMKQRIYEAFVQGPIVDMRAGELRTAVGLSYRENDYQYVPDSLRERDYTNDASAGQFASGSIDESVSVDEIYGELLIPLLANRRFTDSLELELGARASSYSTGQDVSTYKFLTSWAPGERVRVRGGYNRAERAPNMSELFATPSGSSQFSSAPTDPCRTNANLSTQFGTAYNVPGNPDRAALQALCSSQINAWGGNNATDFHADPNAFDLAGGAALIVGNEDLANERGDTWTLGVAFSSTSASFTGTVDWYKAKVTDPIEVQQTSTIVNSCFNVNGLNPSYSLADPLGFCDLIERDPSTGQIVRVYNSFRNEGELEISGVDMNFRWSFDVARGSMQVNTMMNYLIDQVQRYGADRLGDYAGFGGAARFRANTGVTYAWGGRHRLTLSWNYRDGTDTPTTFATTANTAGTQAPTLERNEQITGYKSTSLFNLSAGTTWGPVNISLNVNNLFDKEPRPGGYDIRDPRNGFGSFSPFDDLVGRRYLLNLTMDF